MSSAKELGIKVLTKAERIAMGITQAIRGDTQFPVLPPHFEKASII
jgi:hypothetical protein